MAALFVILGFVLRRVLVWVLAGALARILVGMGLYFVAYKFAVEPMFDQLHALVTTGAGQLALDWFGYFQIDKAITLVTSAYTIRATAKALHLVKS